MQPEERFKTRGCFEVLDERNGGGIYLRDYEVVYLE